MSKQDVQPGDQLMWATVILGAGTMGQGTPVRYLYSDSEGMVCEYERGLDKAIVTLQPSEVRLLD